MRADVKEAIKSATEARWFAEAKLDTVERSAGDAHEAFNALRAALRAQLCLSEALMQLCGALAEETMLNARVDVSSPGDLVPRGASRSFASSSKAGRSLV